MGSKLVACGVSGVLVLCVQVAFAVEVTFEANMNAHIGFGNFDPASQDSARSWRRQRARL